MSAVRAEWLFHKRRNLRLKAVILRRRLRAGVTDPLYVALSRRRPYVYDSSRYVGTFLDETDDGGDGGDEVPNVIWCFWTSDNEMSPARRDSLSRIVEMNSRSRAVLVTPDNLDEHLVASARLHPAYQNLSAVHRSDYLRCYFMHLVGGVYLDVKAPRHPAWPALEFIRGERDCWAVGYPEISSALCAQLPGALGRDVRRRYHELIGCGAFIMRPGTALTSAWYAEVHRRLDRRAASLAASPGNLRGTNPGYPVRWTELVGDVVHPLCLRYHDRIVQYEGLRPILTDYR